MWKELEGRLSPGEGRQIGIALLVLFWLVVYKIACFSAVL
jgi:hypothetical protein